jgi:hypothetical protein
MKYKPMTEQECLAAIAEGDDAEVLLRMRMPQVARRFNALDRSLRRLLADVQVYFPDAQYYTASGGFNLMLGRSHGNNQRPQQQLIALSGRAMIGDGDF